MFGITTSHHLIRALFSEDYKMKNEMKLKANDITRAFLYENFWDSFFYGFFELRGHPSNRRDYSIFAEKLGWDLQVISIGALILYYLNLLK
jgi:hypothetical protein